MRLFELWKSEPLVIHDYLTRFIFPSYMKSQKMKISASGQAVGGEMLFKRRVGFSGTPSDLMPKELGVCDFAKGDDGGMLATLTNPRVCTFEKIRDKWSVEDLLRKIATFDRYHALIDTGALITGYNNEQVARQLLKLGLSWCDGVVFLDEEDRKRVLVRSTGRIVLADQCGIPLDRRFAFYDQIHTTGMDIKHVVNATAVITLGKDMVFRDFAQGAYRMRGIGNGQRIHVFVIPEVSELICKTVRVASKTVKTFNKFEKDESKGKLVEICAWLITNSMRTEQVQWNMLCIQNVANVYRKNAFQTLVSNTGNFKITSGRNALNRLETDSLNVFNERIDFSIESSVPDPVRFADRIRGMIDSHSTLIRKDAEIEICEDILRDVGEYEMLDEGGKTLDQEQEREQQQEQQREVKARRDQEIEVEKFVDQAYRRDNETQQPWHISDLAKLSESEQFYPLSKFKLQHRRPLAFPDRMMVSSNFFNPTWNGLRRIKNCIMVLEVVSDTKRLEWDIFTSSLNDSQKISLSKAFDLFKFDPRDENTNGFTRQDLLALVRSVRAFSSRILLSQ